MMRVRRWLLAAWIVGSGADSGSNRAHASQPRPDLSLFWSGDVHLWDAIRTELAPCSELASARGWFGDIVVHDNEFEQGAPVSVEVTAGLPAEVVFCARDTVKRALRGPGVHQHKMTRAVQTLAVSRSFAVGRPAPLLVPLPRLLQAWTAPPVRARRNLRTLLPTDVTIDADNCLLIPWTDNLQQAFQLWMTETRVRLSEEASRAFAAVQNPHVIAWARAQHAMIVRGMALHQAVLSIPPWLLVVDRAIAPAQRRRPSYRPTRMCLHRLNGDGVPRAPTAPPVSK